MAKDTPVWFNWVVLLIGVLYLLTDFATIDWWNVEWYTAAFILFGLWKVTA